MLLSDTFEPGDFYLFAPKSSLLSSSIGVLFSFGRSGNSSGSSDKSTLERIDALIRNSRRQKSTRERSKKEQQESSVDVATTLGASTWNPSPSTWRLGGGAALVVDFGLFEPPFDGAPRRVQPSVANDIENNGACVFYGFLSNVEELQQERCMSESPYKGSPRGSPKAVTPVFAFDDNSGEASEPKECSSALLYRMYARGEDPLVLLSELQGQFAFVIYDGRQVFAARDPSGKEPLYYDISDDGAVSISNSPIKILSPDGVGYIQWEELLPGQFISGKTPKVQQFALTPDELYAREALDADDSERSPQTTDGPGSFRRNSLSEELSEFGIIE